MTSIVKVGSKGSGLGISLPAELCRRRKIKSGDKLMLKEEGKKLTLEAIV